MKSETFRANNNRTKLIKGNQEGGLQSSSTTARERNRKSPLLYAKKRKKRRQKDKIAAESRRDRLPCKKRLRERKWPRGHDASQFVSQRERKGERGAF